MGGQGRTISSETPFHTHNVWNARFQSLLLERERPDWWTDGLTHGLCVTTLALDTVASPLLEIAIHAVDDSPRFRYIEPTPEGRINIVDVRQWEKDTILVCYDEEYPHRHSSDFQGKHKKKRH